MHRPTLIEIEFAVLALLIGGALIHGILTVLMRLR
jgi:hypothetical protein